MFQDFEPGAATTASAERIGSLRRLMRARGIDAYLVPRGDEHQGEYVPPSAERLAWLTGFTGSAGMAVIGLERAALLVDGRYTVQAAAQIDTRLLEVVQAPPASVKSRVGEMLPEGAVIGFDPWLVTIAQVEQLQRDLAPRQMRLKAVAVNLVDKIWGKARPLPPCAPVRLHDAMRSGEDSAAKIARMQKRLEEAGEDAMVLTQPDSICWLFNIRGGDVAHNPVVLAFAILHARAKPELFIAPGKLDVAVRKTLRQVATLRAPEDLAERLAALKSARRVVRLNPAMTPVWIARRLGRRFRRGPDPVVVAKAVKNGVEIEGARRAHLRDAVAVVRFLAWLDEAAANGTLDEMAAVRRLEALRAETGELKEISFDTISGSGPNGAIVHYRVNRDSNRLIGKGELFLVDSGAQYEDGTTDITRTIAIGKPSAEMRDRFTRVLKGHIAIATARFPKGTRGVDLDSHARMPLWQGGFDYDHGTGHGVGSYLSVHEGPQGISRLNTVALEPGMILSNEPGYYKEGAYGIRIENLVLVLPAAVPTGGEREMLAFETLTLAPIDRRLIDKSSLTASERTWIDAYHARVEAGVSKLVEKEVRAWLAQACRPL